MSEAVTETPVVNANDPIEVAKALELLAKTRQQRAKQKEKVKNDPEAKKKADARALRLRVKNALLVKKAQDAGLTVTDAEITEYIEKNKK